MTQSPDTSSELRVEVEKRIHVAMIHARNTKVEPSIIPMLEDTVNIVMDTLKAHIATVELEARKAEHQSWSIVYGVGYDPDNQELPNNIQTLREKWSRDELDINAQLEDQKGKQTK